MPTLVLICAGVSMACQSKIASLNVLIHSLLRSISAQLPTMSYGCGTLAGPGGFASQRNADSYRSEPGKGACNAMQLMSFISAFVTLLWDQGSTWALLLLRAPMASTILSILSCWDHDGARGDVNESGQKEHKSLRLLCLWGKTLCRRTLATIAFLEKP